MDFLGHVGPEVKRRHPPDARTERRRATTPTMAELVGVACGQRSWLETGAGRWRAA
jgi:hypothetical protein